jgi:cyclin-A
MMVAAKYEEIYPPDIQEFAFLTNETYTDKQIKRMEQVMLRVLSFDLTTPTVQSFIDEFSVHSNMSKAATNMAMV